MTWHKSSISWRFTDSIPAARCSDPALYVRLAAGASLAGICARSGLTERTAHAARQLAGAGWVPGVTGAAGANGARPAQSGAAARRHRLQVPDLRTGASS